MQYCKKILPLLLGLVLALCCATVALASTTKTVQNIEFTFDTQVEGVGGYVKSVGRSGEEIRIVASDDQIPVTVSARTGYEVFVDGGEPGDYTLEELDGCTITVQNSRTSNDYIVDVEIVTEAMVTGLEDGDVWVQQGSNAASVTCHYGAVEDNKILIDIPNSSETCYFSVDLPGDDMTYGLYSDFACKHELSKETFAPPAAGQNKTIYLKLYDRHYPDNAAVYQLVVRRSGEKGHAQLASLQLFKDGGKTNASGSNSGGTWSLSPSFSSSTKNYTVEIPYSSSNLNTLDSLQFKATISQSDADNGVAIVDVDGEENCTASSQGAQRQGKYDVYLIDVALEQPGDKDVSTGIVTITVATADDNETTYTIQIVAKGKGSTLLSSELGDLKVYQKISDSTGKLSNDAMGAFHCDTFRYNVGVAADATEVYLQAKPYQANLKYQDAVITVDGQTFDWQDAVAKSLSNSNQSLYNAGEYMIISLRSPITTVEVACTGPDGTVSQYTLRIEKGGKSSDATTTTHSADHSALSALQVRTSDGSPLALRPGFSSDTMTYTVRLDDSIAGITVKPTSRYDGATIHVDGEKVSSGHWSDTLIVKKDSTQSFVIKVVGENGHTSQYTLRVVKGESTHYETSSTSQTTVQITIGSKVATVNGVQRQMEMAPLLYTYNGGQYTMVPIRFVSEELGGTVGWNNATNTATVTMDGKLVSMTIGHPNPAAGMDCPPILRDTAQGGYTFVPVRYVSESLDCEVLWDQATQTVTIKR